MPHATQVNDFVGWIASRLEWWMFWMSAADDKGLLSKDKVRAMYDGTVWNVLAAEATKKRGYDVFAPKKAGAKTPASAAAAVREVGAQPAKPPPRAGGMASMDGTPEKAGGGKKHS
jgi:hypothetical protein